MWTDLQKSSLANISFLQLSKNALDGTDRECAELRLIEWVVCEVRREAGSEENKEDKHGAYVYRESLGSTSRYQAR